MRPSWLAPEGHGRQNSRPTGLAGGRHPGLPPRRACPPLLVPQDAEWRAVVYLLGARTGGFAILASNAEEVRSALGSLVDEDGEPALLTVDRGVATETTRRRQTGEQTVILADVPWSCLPHFRRAAGVRPSQGQIITLTAEGVPVRPSFSSALSAFGAWISEEDLDEAMLEYVTAEEGAPVEGDEDEAEQPVDPLLELAALRERLDSRWPISGLRGLRQPRLFLLLMPAQAELATCLRRHPAI